MGNVVLVAHKCLDYDAKVLLRNLEEFDISYSDTILGFSDSLLASRQLYTEAPSHRLAAMLEEVGLPVRERHDALDDAEDCRRIGRWVVPQRGPAVGLDLPARLRHRVAGRRLVGS